MNTPDNNLHLAKWQNRLQDAIDAAGDHATQIELRAHLDTCKLCRSEYARLTALDERLKNQFAGAPALRADFSARVFARIDVHEKARREAAKQRAEQEFRARMSALTANWRELWQRHFGSIVAACSVIVTLVAALNSAWESFRQRLLATFDALPWASSAITLPVIAVAGSASLATLMLWWLRAKER